MIKKKITLLGNTDNLFSFSDNVIDNYLIDEDARNSFQTYVDNFSHRSKSHVTYKYIKKHIDNKFEKFDVVRMTKYPLPVTFNTTTRRAVINISALGKRSVNSIEPRDLYALVCYAHTFANLVMSDINKSLDGLVSDFMSAIFLKTFAKRFGLVGSYEALVPSMRFLVTTYVLVSFFDYSPSAAYKKAVALSKFKIDTIKIDLNSYDFSKITNLIGALDKSGTMPGLNLYMFISTMMNRYGNYNLVLFEDLSRFYSLLFTSTINSNTIITPQLIYINEKLSDKILKGIYRDI